MKYKSLHKEFLIIVAFVLMVTSVACIPSSRVTATNAVEEPVVQVINASVNNPLSDHMAPASNKELTDSELEGLLYMREEEKLAGDVYRYLYEEWGASVFQNISTSEDKHADAILQLLNQYGISDPAHSEAGVFSNAELQAFYDQLIIQESQSLEEALMVGAGIEEIDILDLEMYIAETDNSDIQHMYQNLLRGSENHLRSFVRVLGNQADQTYTPQYLSQARYDEIMQGSNGAGGYGEGQQSGQKGDRGSGKGRDS